MNAPNAFRVANSTRLAALALVFGCFGCAVTSVTRSGERFPPFPEDCAIDFRYGDVNKAMQLTASGYVQVASMTVSRAGDSLDENMKAVARPEACKVGAHVAMLVSSQSGDPSYVSFVLLRKQ